MTISKALTAAAALALLLGGCSTFSSSSRAPAPAQAAPAAPAAMVKRVGVVRGPSGSALPQGSVMTLSLYDGAKGDANSGASVTLRNAPAAWPWAAAIEIPAEALGKFARPALGAVVKGPTGDLLYANAAPYPLPASGDFDLPLAAVGF